MAFIAHCSNHAWTKPVRFVSANGKEKIAATHCANCGKWHIIAQRPYNEAKHLRALKRFDLLVQKGLFIFQAS